MGFVDDDASLWHTLRNPFTRRLREQDWKYAGHLCSMLMLIIVLRSEMAQAEFQSMMFAVLIIEGELLIVVFTGERRALAVQSFNSLLTLKRVTGLYVVAGMMW